MARASNIILAIFNSLSLLIGLSIMSLGLFLFASGGSSGCTRVFQNPLIIVGAAITAISLLGLIGSCCRVNIVLTIYLILMFLLLLCLIGFLVFTFLVTNEGAGKAFSKTKIMNFHNWLKNSVGDEKHWNDIKNCSVESKMCKGKKPYDLQFGCCQPPVSCGFVKNGTSWDRPKTSSAVTPSGDCAAWSNQENTLCYNCESCKAAYVTNTRKDWGKMAIANACFIVFTIICYSVGCCARRNNKEDNYTRYRGYP